MRKISIAAPVAAAAAALGGCGGEKVDMANLANAGDWTVVHQEEADLLGPPFDAGEPGGNGLPGEESRTDNSAERSWAGPE